MWAWMHRTWWGPMSSGAGLKRWSPPVRVSTGSRSHHEYLDWIQRRMEELGLRVLPLPGAPRRVVGALVVPRGA